MKVIVAEIMNASSQKSAVDAIHQAEGTGNPIPFFFLWPALLSAKNRHAHRDDGERFVVRAMSRNLSLLTRRNRTIGGFR